MPQRDKHDPHRANIFRRATQEREYQDQRIAAIFGTPSASIASMLTSLIAPCLHAGVNALDYLVALQEHRTAVFQAPAAWLPWNYHANLAPP